MGTPIFGRTWERGVTANKTATTPPSFFILSTYSMADALARPFYDLLPFILYPSQATRVPITFQRLTAYLPIPLTLFLLQCYLVQQPNTRQFRLPIALLVAPWLFFLALAVRWGPPGILVLHVTATMSNIFIGIRSLEFGFVHQPVVRVGTRASSTFSSPIVNGFASAFRLASSLRGIDYSFGVGTGLKIPPTSTRTRTRSAWLMHMFFRHVLLNIFIIDVVTNRLLHMKFMWDVKNGGHLNEAGWVGRLILTASVPITADAGLSAGYSIAAIIGVLTRMSDPPEWPPLFHYPILATSLHDFWAFRWHQVLRRTFLITAGYPFGAIFGPIGLIFGVFASSGFFHSIILIGNGATYFDWATFNFFAVQTVGLFVEQMYRKVTGRKVEGTLGRVWTGLWFFLLAADACTVWTQICLDNLEFFPLHLSPSQRIFDSLGL